jgi:hypothetical protein
MEVFTMLFPVRLFANENAGLTQTFRVSHFPFWNSPEFF